MLAPMDDAVAEYVQDYKIALIEPARIADSEFEKFGTDLGAVLQFMKYVDDKESLSSLLKSEDVFSRINIKAARVLKECGRIDVEVESGLEDKNMSKAWEEQKQDGINIGLNLGLNRGKIEQLISQVRKKILKGLAPAEIADIFEEDEKLIEELYALIQNNPEVSNEALAEQYLARDEEAVSA